MPGPLHDTTIQCHDDHDLELTASVYGVSSVAGGADYFRVLKVKIHRQSEASDSVKFYLPVDDDSALEAVVTGILDSCPRLKDKLLSEWLVPAAPWFGGMLLEDELDPYD